MGMNYLSLPKLQRLHRWSLGLDKWFHPTLYKPCDYLSMLGLKLIHVSKMGPWCVLFFLLYRQSLADSRDEFPNTWWRHQMETFSRYWPVVRGIHRSSVDSPHKGQWRGALMSSLIYVWINGWANTRDTGDLRRHRVPYDVTVIIS